jgi:hypothetical protein
VRAFLAELESEFDPLPPWERLAAEGVRAI